MLLGVQIISLPVKGGMRCSRDRKYDISRNRIRVFIRLLFQDLLFGQTVKGEFFLVIRNDCSYIPVSGRLAYLFQ